MENQIYRLHEETENSAILEFWVADTNELNPHKDIKEMAITVEKKETRLDFELDVFQTESLIKYLSGCLKYIKEFNKTSKPENKNE